MFADAQARYRHSHHESAIIAIRKVIDAAEKTTGKTPPSILEACAIVALAHAKDHVAAVDKLYSKLREKNNGQPPERWLPEREWFALRMCHRDVRKREKKSV